MSMRILITALALTFPVVACQPAVQPPPEVTTATEATTATDAARPAFSEADEAAIRSSLDGYVAGMVAQDWAAIVGYYTSDAVRMPPNEPMIQGHAAIQTALEAMAPVTAFTLSPQAVSGDGDLAYARGAYTIALAPADAAPVNEVGKWQAAYRRQADGSWLCVSDIWNADAPTAM